MKNLDHVKTYNHIVTEVRKGKTFAAIAKQIGISREMVYVILRKISGKKDIRRYDLFAVDKYPLKTIDKK